MMEDKRCCGSGSCIINEEGICWCGQKWEGERLVPTNLDNQKSEKIDKKEPKNSENDSNRAKKP